MAGDRGGIELSDDERPGVRAGTWVNRGERVLYSSAWMELALADVVLPDGNIIEHHLVALPRPAAGTVITRDGAVLLLYRHRFITDSWGWEIPAGMVDEGETIEQAAIREAVEESGWEPRSVEPVCAFNPAVGAVRQTFHIFVSRDAEHRGEPEDRNEATRIEWIDVADLTAMLANGEINDGLSFGGLAFALVSGVLSSAPD